jgi:hypothetical protein
MLRKQEARMGSLGPAGADQGEGAHDHSMDALQYVVAILSLGVAVLLALSR